MARATYTKVELIGLQLIYPYELGLEAWIDNVTLLPPAELPDIVLYLCQNPGQHTCEKLKACKSLDSEMLTIKSDQ